MRTSGSHLHTDDIDANSIVLPVAFPGDLLLFGENGVRPPQVYDDTPLFETLDDPVDQLPLTLLEFVIDNFALGVPHSLDNVLLGCLGRDSTKGAGIQLGQELIAQLRLRIEIVPCLLKGNLGIWITYLPYDPLGFKKLNLPKLGVKLRLNLPLVTIGLFSGRDHGVFQGTNEDRLINALFLTDLFNDSI